MSNHFDSTQNGKQCTKLEGICIYFTKKNVRRKQLLSGNFNLIQCLALKPFKSKTLNLLAQLCQKYQKSLYFIDQSSKVEKRNFKSLLIKAQILIELKQYQKALLLLQESLLLKDDYTTTHYTISKFTYISGYALCNIKGQRKGILSQLKNKLMTNL
ncbi:hypothetical protein pb186bvf_010862 [Paramecium bursaria]